MLAQKVEQSGQEEGSYTPSVVSPLLCKTRTDGRKNHPEKEEQRGVPVHPGAAWRGFSRVRFVANLSASEVALLVFY